VGQLPALPVLLKITVVFCHEAQRLADVFLGSRCGCVVSVRNVIGYLMAKNGYNWVTLPLGANRPQMGENGYAPMPEINSIAITPEILKLIAEIDEFKGRWTVIETLAPEKLTHLRRIATIESVGSSTRIEGAKLSDADVEKLL
jgi:hypothetical protein